MNETYEYLLQHANELYLVDTKALEASRNQRLKRKLTKDTKYESKYEFMKYLLSHYQGFSLDTFDKRALSFIDYLETRRANDERLINNNIAHMIDLIINGQDRQQCWMIFKMYTTGTKWDCQIIHEDTLKNYYPEYYKAIVYAYAFDNSKFDRPYKHPNGNDAKLDMFNALSKRTQTLGREHPDKLHNQWLSLAKGDPANLNKLLKSRVVINDQHGRSEFSFYDYLVKKNYKLVNSGVKWQIIHCPLTINSDEPYAKSILPMLEDHLNRQAPHTKIHFIR